MIILKILKYLLGGALGLILIRTIQNLDPEPTDIRYVGLVIGFIIYWMLSVILEPDDN